MKWIKRALRFLVLLVVFVAVGKLIDAFWPDVTDCLASWFDTVGVEETTNLLFDSPSLLR